MENRAVVTVLVVALLAGTGAVTPPATTPVSSSDSTPADSMVADSSSTASTPDANVSVEINCTAGTVTVVAPPTYEHQTMVRLVYVASEHRFPGGGWLDSTAGNRTVPVRRNDTGDNPEEVYVFVWNASSALEPTDPGADPVAVARRTCDAVPESAAPDRPHERNGTVIPAVTIDCEADEVRFQAPDDAAYYQRISSVVVEPRRASVGGSGGSSGWNDEHVETNGTVFVTIYDDNPLLGGERLYTVYERCGPPVATNRTHVRPSHHPAG